MPSVTKSTLVPAPRDAVWDVLADFAAISRWAPNVDHSCLMTEQVEGVGTIRRIQTGRATVRETVTVWEPARVVGYEITGLPAVVERVTNTWTLDDHGDETTATLVTDIEVGPRPPQRVAAKVVARVMGGASDQMLEGLAAQFEQEAAR